MKPLYDYIKESGATQEITLQEVADQIITLFGQEFEKPNKVDIEKYINQNKSKYTGQDNQYDIRFYSCRNAAQYRRQFEKFAQEFTSKYGGTFKKSSGYNGSTYKWLGESILQTEQFSIGYGKRIGNRKYPTDDISNACYITIDNKELWDKIVKQL